MTSLPVPVRQLAERIAAAHGVEILEADLRGGGRARLLNVVLDAEEPIEADVVEQVTKELSRALDTGDPIPGTYTLQVTTPGLDRPLVRPRDFRRQRGHEVRVTRRAEPAAVEPEPVQGTVVEADDDRLVLDTATGQVQLPFGEVVQGRVVLPW